MLMACPLAGHGSESAKLVTLTPRPVSVSTQRFAYCPLFIRPDEVFTVRAEMSKHSSCDVDPSIPQGEREKLKASSDRIERFS